MADMLGTVATQVRGVIGEIEFSHPKANCLPRTVLTRLTQAVEEFSQDDRVRVICIQSSGSGAFCGGASFEDFKQVQNAFDGKAFFLGFSELLLAIRSSTKFVVCRVQGKVVGGGVGIAAAADYTLASIHASARLSEFELGIGPFVIGPAVTRKIGLSAFSAMSIDCSERSADWLLERGLYTQIFSEQGELERATLALLEKLGSASIPATHALRKTLWEGTEDWERLLPARAELSGRLLAEKRDIR